MFTTALTRELYDAFPAADDDEILQTLESLSRARVHLLSRCPMTEGDWQACALLSLLGQVIIPERVATTGVN